MLQLSDLAARGEGESPQGRAVAAQLLDALKVRGTKAALPFSNCLSETSLQFHVLLCCAVQYSKADYNLQQYSKASH